MQTSQLKLVVAFKIFLVFSFFRPTILSRRIFQLNLSPIWRMASFLTKLWRKCELKLKGFFKSSVVNIHNTYRKKQFCQFFFFKQRINALFGCCQVLSRYYWLTFILCSDPTYFTLTRIHQNVYGDINLRMQNLETLVKHLKLYYQVRLNSCMFILYN